MLRGFDNLERLLQLSSLWLIIVTLSPTEEKNTQPHYGQGGPTLTLTYSHVWHAHPQRHRLRIAVNTASVLQRKKRT